MRTRKTRWIFTAILALSCLNIGMNAKAQTLLVNGKNAEYSTSKYFIDERAGDSVTINVSFDLSGVANLTAVELFTNLGRREYVDNDWDGDGAPDGVKQADFNTITLANYASGSGGVQSYYRPYSMADQGGNYFTATLVASKCGAYRLTARFQTSDDPGKWQWYPAYYQSNGYAFPEAQQAARSHAIVISPIKTLEMTLYELNTLTIEATDNTFFGRSTFNDLLGPTYDTDGHDYFNLDHLNAIQANCLWFQPIHPNGDDARTLAEGYDPGSPYATRNYFAVTSIMGDPATEAQAMIEFTNFVHQCDIYGGSVGTINVMLDFVANHTSWDAVFGQGGADLFGLDPSRRIGWDRPNWYSDGDNFGPDYCNPADWYNTEWDNDMMNAPDRGDFGKWADTMDLYFGRYAALVCRNPTDDGNYLNEGDWVDYLAMNTEPGIVEMWRYFGYYPEYWIKRSGHPGNNSDPSRDDV
ncbi:MAG: hypothetical protein KJ626_08320, partial [Verrucomicrobia bacterium]|nr:hypothetical protein [Verrucomicrobiota bacterium]